MKSYSMTEFLSILAKCDKNTGINLISLFQSGGVAVDGFYASDLEGIMDKKERELRDEFDAAARVYIGVDDALSECAFRLWVYAGDKLKAYRKEKEAMKTLYN